MMGLFINALAAKAGGGLTYIRNVIPHLAAKTNLQLTVAISPGLRQEFRHLSKIQFLEMDNAPERRFWREQSRLPGLIRRSGSDVLLSTGNFALRRSPVPQILLSRNSIYWSRDFYADLLARREYRAWLDTRVKAIFATASIRCATATVAPSEAFAAELQRVTGHPIRAIHHGFDSEEFFRDLTPLNEDTQQKLARAGDALRLLFVSHYNYYRNFETLIRALPLLRRVVTKRPVRLFLTCKLIPGENPGTYNPQDAAQLVKELRVEDMVVELGPIPYRQLHQLYRSCHVYVTPAYTETFAHPLVEAMASGLAVVASDIPVHREICAEAAVYFERFSPEAVARCVHSVMETANTAEQMSDAGCQRSQQFSWQVHVDRLLDLARTLLEGVEKTD